MSLGWRLTCWGGWGPQLKLVDAVADVLDSDQPLLRQCAAGALAEMGPAARSAAARLREMAKSDPDEENREVAAEALRKIDS